MDKGRTPQGVRGLKYAGLAGLELPLGRTPQGVRGLKFQDLDTGRLHYVRRTPQGVRGLKFVERAVVPDGLSRRTPQGVRGLKCAGIRGQECCAASHPARGAWIEMKVQRL